MLGLADLALLTILAVSMGVGLWRGFIVEVLSLTAWIAAFWLTIAFGSTVAGWFGGVESPSARQFLGHAAVFLTVLVAGGGITWAIGKVIAGTGLSAMDRLLGVGFGLARGVVVACVAVLLLGFTPAPQDGWWRESRLLPRAQRGAEWMATFLPPTAAAELDFSPTPVDPISPASPDATHAGPEALVAPSDDASSDSAVSSDTAAPPVPET